MSQYAPNFPHDHATALDACRRLNDSPMQRKLREKREMFVAAVYWWPGDQG